MRGGGKFSDDGGSEDGWEDDVEAQWSEVGSLSGGGGGGEEKKKQKGRKGRKAGGKTIGDLMTVVEERGQPAGVVEWDEWAHGGMRKGEGKTASEGEGEKYKKKGLGRRKSMEW